MPNNGMGGGGPMHAGPQQMQGGPQMGGGGPQMGGQQMGGGNDNLGPQPIPPQPQSQYGTSQQIKAKMSMAGQKASSDTLPLRRSVPV